jgi:MATE family multidrug resistance protein
MTALVSANVVNWLFNWLLIYGHAGLPAMGVAGSALSTCLARVYMAGFLGAAAWRVKRTMPSAKARASVRAMAQILKIGLPAATQIILEIGAFGAVGILAGRLTPVALAAHQIALNCAALSFMVPLGTSSAAAVAVGHAVGGGEPEVARRAGFIAMGLACAFMALSAALFLSAPRQILQIYSLDPGVLATGTTLLALAAAFQLFDGLQTVATGALRGTGHTRLPMWANLFGYWFFGLPLGYVLCFVFGWGVYGLWCGLTAALIVIALVLVLAWNVSSRRITHLPVRV